MAELSTVDRPYAEGLMEALLGSKASDAEMAQVLSTIEHLAATVGDPQVLQLATDPKVTKEKLFDLIVDVVGKLNPVEVENLLRVVIDNGRLSIFPEIAKQFRQLKNDAEVVEDVYIVTAFAMDDAQLRQVLELAAKKFPGKKLNPIVTVDKKLIGGVKILVGDKLLDASIRAQLERLQAVLTA